MIVALLALTAGPASSGTGDGIGKLRALIAKHVCTSSLSRWGNCGAIVLAEADGSPAASSTPPATALGPSQFHSAYNLPTQAAGAETIAIVDAYDDPNAESDLAAFDSYYGLPSCTTANGCFRKVNQTGGTAYPASNSGWSLEISLDIETAHEICQNCKILLVEASSASTADLGTAENEAVALGANAISNSWLSSEYSGEATDEAKYFDHPGVAMTAATGDNGYGVGFPAASRYVTAVGGTTLTLSSSGSYVGETAWSDTGGGCSGYIPKPSWQTDTGCAKRTEADVSADADPSTGAAVFDSVPYSGQTGWFQVGGTSLATPLIAAAYALAGNTSAVNGASSIYAHAGSIHDVTSGSNGSCFVRYLCKAGFGYDGPTGLGTPNGLGAFGGSGGSSPPPTADFSLGASPGSQTVSAGSSTSFTVTLTPSGGFSSSVGLSVAGLPTGASGSFAPSSVTSSTPSTLTVTTSSSVSPNTYPLTITGTGGGLTHMTSATLVVQAATASDFSVGVVSSSQTVTQGSAATYSVSLTRTGGFTGTVGFTTSGLPSGATGVFTPSSLTSGGGSSTSLGVSTTASLTPGSYAFTITGTSGALVHSAAATLVVQSGGTQAGDFSIKVSPSSATLPPTGSARLTITISPLNGSVPAVTLSAAGLPVGVSAVFVTNPTTSTSTLILTTKGAQPTLGRTITITGRSGTYSHSISLTLRVP